MHSHAPNATSDAPKSKRRTGSFFSRRGSIEPSERGTKEQSDLPKLQSATPILRNRRVSHDHNAHSKQHLELRKVRSATPVSKTRRMSHEPTGRVKQPGAKTQLAPPRTRSNAYDRVKRLSHVKLGFDTNVWHHFPENTSLAALEAAMAKHPQEEILSAIGRSQSLRPSSSERRRYPIAYQTTDRSVGPQTPRKDAVEPRLLNSNKPTSRRRASSMIMPNIQAVRQLTVATHDTNISTLKSKFASPLLQAELGSRKSIVRLRMSSTAPTPPLKPINSLRSRALPPIPMEIAIDSRSFTQSSALSSPAMIIDDSNLILHHSVTSPYMVNSGPLCPRINNVAEELQKMQGYAVGYDYEDDFDQTTEANPDKTDVNSASPTCSPEHFESHPDINEIVEPRSGEEAEPISNLDMMTFFAADSDSEDEDEDEDPSSGSSGQSSMTSYEFPTPKNGQSANVSPKPADDESNEQISDTAGQQLPVSMEQVNSIYSLRKSPLCLEDHTDSEAVLKARRVSKVTWSQAQGELENQLLVLTEQSGKLTPASPTPPLPRRSFRRHFQQAVRARNFSRPLLSRRSTAPASAHEGPCVRALKRRNSDDFTHNPSDLSNRPLSSRVLCLSEAMINPDVAEDVVFQILSGLDSFDDLFACALTNKGFYSVFKRNELTLLKVVLYNQSPAAWELRETSPKQIIARESTQNDYTPKTYRQFQRRDTYVIDALKSLILSRCQSFLRPETINALRGENVDRANEINNAFWRVWTFCLLFGSDKGREEDVVGQMDWLRGGALAHQATCSSTIVWSEPMDMTSILLNPPESFGGGNSDGLSTDELHDMTEIWNCLKALLYGILGESRLAQAKENGVFDDNEGKDGDASIQESMLEEWLYHLTTLGLSTVLDLATPSTSSEPTVFVVAREMGWTTWKPPPNGGSRSTFLKEAVARVYEEKLLRSRTPEQESEEEEELKIRQYRKLRSAIVAAELKEKKRGTDYSTAPISEDRPMSLWEDWQSRLDKQSREKQGFTRITEEEVPPSPGIVHPAFREKAATPKRSSTKSSHRSAKSRSKKSPQSSRTPTQKEEAPKNLSKAEKVLGTSIVVPKRSSLSPQKPTQKTAMNNTKDVPARTSSAFVSLLMPNLKPNRFSRDGIHASPKHSALRLKRPSIRLPGIHRKSYNIMQTTVVGDASTDKAIFRIVDMGFTVEEARDALKMTDPGDGMDVDRAVAWLLNKRN